MSSAGRANTLLHTGQVRSHLMAGRATLPWKERTHRPPPPSHTYRERTENMGEKGVSSPNLQVTLILNMYYFLST